MSFDDRIMNDTAPEKQVLTVRQLNEAISDAMRRSFPGTVWVRGEVQRLPVDAAGRAHVYFELHETGQSGAAEYQIPVSLMSWDRQRHGLGRFLDGTDPDLQLANKLEVCLECQVDFYAKFGKLSLKIVGVDKSFSLGKLEAQRRETLAFLKAEGLLERNAAIPLSDIPLRVGLITSPGSAAERDFMTGLEASPFAFLVTLRGARMQGEQLQSEVIAALRHFQTQAVDAIVITRGGGSRADLSWFDQRELAVAIAGCPVPVITAIGHEIDRSIADLVAHHSCKTPTAAAEFLVDRVGEAALKVEEAAERLTELVDGILTEARQRVEVQDRVARAARSIILNSRIRFQRAAGRFQSLVTAQLSRRQRRLAGLETRLLTRVGATVDRSGRRLDRLQMKLVASSQRILAVGWQREQQATRDLRREVLRPVKAAARNLDNLRAKARLLDPVLLLGRGYTMTLGPSGKALTSVTQLTAGDRIRTRFADGEAASIVEQSGEGPGPQKPPQGKGKKGGGKSKENPGQKTLFQ